MVNPINIDAAVGVLAGEAPRQGVQIKMLDRKNPEYTFFSDAWEMLSVLYEGGVKLRANVDKFVMRRPKELYDVFYERVRRLTYQDILQCCVSWYLSKMFQREPVITDKDKNRDLVEFQGNCDRCNTTFNKFSRDMLEKMMLFRRGFVLVDKPRPDGSRMVQTRLQEKVAGLHMPYLVLFDPRNVINWKLDQYGNLEWVVIKTVDINQEDPLGGAKVLTNWWIFDKQTYRKFQFAKPVPDGVDANQFLTANENIASASGDQLAELIDEGPHALFEYNMVPVVVSELPTDLWHANRAFLHLLEHVDTMNAYSWKLFMANLPQLVIFSEEEQTGKSLSESGFLQFGPGDKIEWLEPKGSSFQESRLHLAGMRQEIYRSFHLQAHAKDSTATADGSSGYSKEVEMMPSTDICNALGDYLREYMQRVLHYAKLAGGMGENVPDVNGFQFEIHPTLANISKYQAAWDSGIISKSPTLERTVAADIAMDMVDGKNEDIKATIQAEIEKSEPTPFDPTAKTGPSGIRNEFGIKDQRAQAGNILRAEGQTQ